MMPTFSERQALAKQFSDNIARMRRCVRAAGKEVEDDDIIYAWADYSDSWCAGWLMLPDNDYAWLAILLKHLPPPGNRWHTSIQHADDCSRDGILQLPDGLLTQLGGKEGDSLSITKDASDALIVRRHGH